MIYIDNLHREFTFIKYALPTCRIAKDMMTYSQLLLQEQE